MRPKDTATALAALAGGGPAPAPTGRSRTLGSESQRVVFLLENYMIPFALKDLRLQQLDFRAFLNTSHALQTLIYRHGRGLLSLFRNLCAASEQARQKRNPFVPKTYLTPYVDFGARFADIPAGPDDGPVISPVAAGSRRSSTSALAVAAAAGDTGARPGQAPLTAAEVRSAAEKRAAYTAGTPSDYAAVHSELARDAAGKGVTVEALEAVFQRANLIGLLLSHRNLHVACALARDENSDQTLLSFPCMIEALARIACSIAVTTAQFHAASGGGTEGGAGSSAATNTLLGVAAAASSSSSSAAAGSGASSYRSDPDANPAHWVTGLSVPSSAEESHGSGQSAMLTRYTHLVWRNRTARAKIVDVFRRMLAMLGVNETPAADGPAPPTPAPS